ncbi:MAG: helicase-exonuclease AddAB subunit AddA [Clostridiales bacterium]|jgi:ATP-dependent helicase/nuclease subunit A|nr:helicase-exonuclease AddAB subunit AddA [Clostridiales bacterium]
MSETKFTPDQRRAIETDGCDLLVSAAAGSGKTAVLVERIIRMITNKEKPVDVDKLLVVTFTDAAASEMRQRILKAIDDLRKTETENEHLKRQEMLMSRASIMTIHSFCLGVIRKYFYLIDIDPGFRIIDTTEADLLKAETMRGFIEALYDKENAELLTETFGAPENAAFLNLVDCYGDKVKDDKLQELLLKVYDFIQSCPFPEQWLAESAEKLAAATLAEMERSEWYAYFAAETRMALTSALTAADLAAALCGHPEINPVALSALVDDREKIETALSALEKSFADFYDAMQFSFATMRLSAAKKGEDVSEEAAALKDKILAIRKDDIKTPVATIQKKALFMPPQAILENMRQSAVLVKTVCAVVAGFSKQFYALKRSRNIADFSDFEHLCIQTLLAEDGNPSIAAAELREKYEAVLMDEYQDSNLVQELILSTVARGGRGERNRFMVGDIKQSIYKFRMANPDLFRQKYLSYALDGQGETRRIDLSKNFRSRKSVLDSINFIFKQILSEDLGEIQYDPSAYLYYGADYPESVDDTVHQTEILIMDTAEDQPAEDTGTEAETGEIAEEPDDEPQPESESDDLIAELSNAELEAKMVAARISELLGSDGKTRPFQVAERGGGFRDIMLRDIVVLLRSTKTVAESYVRALKNANLTAFSDAAGGYFEAVEIMTALSFLRVIDNPRQDIHLIAVLYSPVYAFSPDELADIRRTLDKGLFFDCVNAYMENAEKNGRTAEKLRRFLSDLEKWRAAAVYAPISDLVQLVYEDTGYLDYAGAMPGGKVRQANLTALFERALQYEKTRLKGLFHFIRYIEKMQKNKAEFGAAKVLGAHENLIRVMSIHKSKGLEFPVVFVSGLGRNFNLRDASQEVLLHQGLGFGPVRVDAAERVKYNTLARYAVSGKIVMESLSEEMRVLYVALTRAKEKLILTACVKDAEKKINGLKQYLPRDCAALNPYRLSRKRTFLDWILFAVLRHRDIAEENFADEVYNDASRWRLSIQKKAAFRRAAAEKEARRLDLRAAFQGIDPARDYSGRKDEIAAALNYTYAAGAALIPSKLSISEIKRIHDESRMKESETFEGQFAARQTVELKRPDFMADTRENGSAAKKGTLLHAVMERLDLEKHRTAADVAGLVAEMAEKKIIAAEDAALIDQTKITRFIETDIAERMRRAGGVRKEIPFVLGVSPAAVDPRWADAADETILVHGIIDCLFEEAGEPVLLDYKSDRVNAQTLESVLARYRVQMEMYRRAIEANTGKHVKESLIYFFELGQCYPV